MTKRWGWGWGPWGAIGSTSWLACSRSRRNMTSQKEYKTNVLPESVCLRFIWLWCRWILLMIANYYYWRGYMTLSRKLYNYVINVNFFFSDYRIWGTLLWGCFFLMYRQIADKPLDGRWSRSNCGAAYALTSLRH